MNRDDKFWGRIRSAVELVASEGARRIDGGDEQCAFKVYAVPGGVTRIDIQPKEQ